MRVTINFKHPPTIQHFTTTVGQSGRNVGSVKNIPFLAALDNKFWGRNSAPECVSTTVNYTDKNNSTGKERKSVTQWFLAGAV
jgi:hypothetical protein